MSESKQRKLLDPSYGKRPKGGNGIMLVPTFYQNGTDPSVTIAAELSADQLRFALCFWDRIAWPRIPHIPQSDNADIVFLRNAGVLTRPEATWQPNLTSAAHSLAESYFKIYQELARKEVGRWSLSAAAEFDIQSILGEVLVPDQGITVSLHRAIPIPTSDVALHDLLEFKQKRDSELLALRAELDDYKQLIAKSTDRAQTYAIQKDRIDAACVDLLVVSREAQLPVCISDMSMTFEMNGGGIAPAIAAAAALPNAFNFDHVQTLLASLGLFVASGIKLTATFGTRKAALKKSPFRYVHYLHEEIDWG